MQYFLMKIIDYQSIFFIKRLVYKDKNNIFFYLRGTIFYFAVVIYYSDSGLIFIKFLMRKWYISRLIKIKTINFYIFVEYVFLFPCCNMLYKCGVDHYLVSYEKILYITKINYVTHKSKFRVELVHLCVLIFF